MWAFLYFLYYVGIFILTVGAFSFLYKLDLGIRSGICMGIFLYI
jgi:hypothetical protein